jgi:ABC-2 type transport system ATP-binding protein
VGGHPLSWCAAAAPLLLTTQYLEEADLLADEIVVIDHGRAIAQRHRRLAEVAGGRRAGRGGRRTAVRRRAGARRCSAAVSTGSVQLDPHTRRLTAPVTGGGKVLVEALGRLDAAGIEVLDVSLRRPTLDDVFLSLTGRPDRGARRRRGPAGPPRSTARSTR